MSDNSGVLPAKDIQFSFSSFLWKDLSEIRTLQKAGKHYEALWHLLDLIDWLPEDFQEKMQFQEKATEIRRELKKVSTNRILPYQKQIDLQQQVDQISYTILKNIVPHLSKSLDKKGYMERRGGVQTINRSMKDFQMDVDRARYGSE